MSWDRNSLWTKARLFAERAFEQEETDPTFGLWCSFVIELLARSAVSSVSPALLAEPHPEHLHLLHAFGKGSARSSKKSIGTSTVLNLCRHLFPNFTEEDKVLALAMTNRRNEEVHTGSAAFQEFPVKDWIIGFYRVCKNLCESMGESLETLLGKEQAEAAATILLANDNDVLQRVKEKVAAFTKVFNAKPLQEREKITEATKIEGDRLARERYHRVSCPACKSVALVQGVSVGTEKVTYTDDGEIYVYQQMRPKSCECRACGLQLDGYSELHHAGLGGFYRRKTTYQPEEYFGLVHPDSPEFEELAIAYMKKHADDGEYDNE